MFCEFHLRFFKSVEKNHKRQYQGTFAGEGLRAAAQRKEQLSMGLADWWKVAGHFLCPSSSLMSILMSIHVKDSSTVTVKSTSSGTRLLGFKSRSCHRLTVTLGNVLSLSIPQFHSS